MQWKLVEGTWRWPYRISDQGIVQKQLKNGEWREIKPYMYNGQMRAQMWINEKDWKRVQVAKLVVDAFMGGTPPGMVRAHRNLVKQDNAAENLCFMTKAESRKRYRAGNSLSVFKVDRDGNVVAVYRSGSEAARKNNISQAAISKRCLGLVDDPYRLDDHNYVFEDRRYRVKK